MANFNLGLWRHARLLSVLPFSALTLAAVAVQPGNAADDAFFACTADLLDAGISRESATAACAASRYPSDLSGCAVEVSDATGIAAADALNVCERSRRPDEVANCTLNIHDSLLDAPSLSAHTFCGRSLLPERYGVCVVDLVGAAGLSVDESLTRCIRAGYRPWEIGPRL
ncbi:MAG: hypothetical protein AAFU71_12765 [Cyanobacteria bacterium J06632_22]